MEKRIPAARQGGLFTWRDARRAGYSPWQIRARIADGRWRQLVGPVLGLAGTPDTPFVRDLAGYLAAGDHAVLSGPSAARVHGIEVPIELPCVTVPPRRHLELPGVRLLRERVPDEDIEVVEYLLVTGRAKTVFDCVRLLPPVPAAALLDRALQKRWISMPQFEARVRGHGRRHGGPALRRLLTDASGGARSALERILHRRLRAARISGWVANYEVWGPRSLLGVVDVAFPEVKLAIEVDGRAHHTSADRFQRDRTRQNALVNAGWTVLRFTWADLTERPDGVIGSVRDALRRLSA